MVKLVALRDCNGTFEPAVVPLGERYPEGLDDWIVSLCARGMTMRDFHDR